MASKLKSETARRNGAKSKGPTTAAGLEKSSQNALKHGFTSSIIVLACESQSDFDDLRNDFVATYKPSSAAETDLVDEMVVCRWRIHRLWGIETSLMDAEYLHQESAPAAHTYTSHMRLALTFRALADDSRALLLASRYESRLHRIYNHAYATLRELQQARDPLPPAAPIPIAPANPEPETPTPLSEPGPVAVTRNEEAAKGTQGLTKVFENRWMKENGSARPGLVAELRSAGAPTRIRKAHGAAHA